MPPPLPEFNCNVCNCKGLGTIGAAAELTFSFHPTTRRGRERRLAQLILSATGINTAAQW